MGINSNIVFGKFFGTKITYRSKNGSYLFVFNFVDRGRYIEMYCTKHPSFNGQDKTPSKCHLYGNGKISILSGKEPRSWSRAESLAAQWSEYFLEYRRTGQVQE